MDESGANAYRDSERFSKMVRMPLAIGIMFLVVLPAARPAEPALVSGKWTLTTWGFPLKATQQVLLTVQEKDGKPIVTAAEGKPFQWVAKDLEVSGRRVRLTITGNGVLVLLRSEEHT